MPTDKLEKIRFISHSDSDPYRCSKPQDQSGEYYRVADVDAEIARLREALERIANGPYIETREIARAALDNGDE